MFNLLKSTNKIMETYLEGHKINEEQSKSLDREKEKEKKAREFSA
jgi:hypothetical protein